MRIGQGVDFHQLALGEKLILGGCVIPWEFGLVGHSDADVVTHAVMDALLGALGAGDIGEVFPDDDPAYKDISSLKLLRELKKEFWPADLKLGNLDVTIIAEKPRLKKYKANMQENLACTLGAKNDRVNIKATTTEGMGFLGEEKGIAAMAILLLVK